MGKHDIIHKIRSTQLTAVSSDENETRPQVTTGNTYRKFHKVWKCRFSHVWVGRCTDRQTYTHAHHNTPHPYSRLPVSKPGRQWVQALADISHLALCHRNKTCAPTANPPNTAQLEGTPYHSANLHPGPWSSVGMRRGTDTPTAVTTIHFTSATPHAKCNTNIFHSSSLSKSSKYGRGNGLDGGGGGYDPLCPVDRVVSV